MAVACWLRGFGASGKEVEITAMLQDALTDLLAAGSVRGYSAAIFSAPIRGQEIEDYSGRYLEKRPDLTVIRLSARPSINHNAMFYECKVLGRGRSVDDYIDNGVSRFQNGLYAWAMPHAGMIAYVTDGHTDNAYVALADRWSDVRRPASHAPIGIVEEDRTSSLTIAISTHAREFVLRNGEEAGTITLRHLWLADSRFEWKSPDLAVKRDAKRKSTSGSKTTTASGTSGG